MGKLRIGVLSVSNHLLKRVVLAVSESHECEIYAIASRDLNKAQEFAQEFNIPKVHFNYDALLADDQIDAVYIPLPNHLHAQWICKAADYGKHILVEKPITIRADEAIDSLEFAHSKGVKLMEGFMYKFHPQWIRIRDIIRTNQIGKIQYIHTSFSYNNPSKTNIRNIKDYGGGAMFDIGSYAVSVPRFLLQKEPKRVVSTMKFNAETGVDILSSGIIDFEEAHATFSVSTLSEANQYVEIVCTAGRITIPIPFNAYVDTKTNIIVSTAQGQRIVEFDVCDQYTLMFNAFAQAIVTDAPMPYAGNDAINNMKVLDAIFKSAETDQWESIS